MDWVDRCGHPKFGAKSNTFRRRLKGDGHDEAEAGRPENIKKARKAHSKRSHGRGVKETDEGLSTANKNRVATTTFAFEGKRKEPLNDASHVRNAVARFDQVEGVTEAEKDKAWERIRRAARKYDVGISTSDWRDLGKGSKAKNPGGPRQRIPPSRR